MRDPHPPSRRGRESSDFALRMPLAPVSLEDAHVVLEPLTRDHVAGLEAAAADGELWNLRVTYVPPPGAMLAYVDHALLMQAAGESLPFAV